MKIFEVVLALVNVLVTGAEEPTENIGALVELKCSSYCRSLGSNKIQNLVFKYFYE